MRRFLPVLLAVLLVLAGCNGIGFPGSSGDSPITDPNATTDTGTPGTPDQNVTAESVKTDALAAIDDVETYRLHVEQRTRYSGNQTANTTVNGTFDRTARDAALNQSQVVNGFAFTAETYIDGENGTLYQHSDVLEQQYGSSWVAADISKNVSAVWAQYDTLTRQRALLAASNVTLDGVRNVNGTDTYVLRGTSETNRSDGLGVGSGGTIDVSNVSATFYVSVEDATLVRTTVDLEGIQQARGRRLSFERTVDLRFSGYGDPVTVDIPDEARTKAVSVENGTGT